MKMRLMQRLGLVTKRGGYTLTEVMVAVVLMLLMILALYGAFSNGFAILTLSRENLRATQVLVRQMENLRLYTWSQLTDTNYLPRNYVDSYDPTSVSNSGAVYYV